MCKTLTCIIRFCDYLKPPFSQSDLLYVDVMPTLKGYPIPRSEYPPISPSTRQPPSRWPLRRPQWVCITTARTSSVVHAVSLRLGKRAAVASTRVKPLSCSAAQVPSARLVGTYPAHMYANPNCSTAIQLLKLSGLVRSSRQRHCTTLTS